VVAEKPEPLLAPALKSYRLGPRMPVLVKWDNLQPAVTAPPASIACVVVMGPTPERLRITTLLAGAWPDLRRTDVYSRDGEQSVSLLYALQLQASR
jgi:hypothetical protein